MKAKHVCLLLMVSLLLSSLALPFPVLGETASLEWVKVDKPGEMGNLVVVPSEVSDIAVGGSGVVYAIDSENSKVYRSLDAGVTWEDITPYLADAGAGLPASRIAVSPDKAGIVAVVTNAGSGVYLSTNGGMTWSDTHVPSLVGTIQAITISENYTQDSQSLTELAIGTAKWGDGAITGQVWVFQSGRPGASWQNQNLDLAPTGGDVSAIAYSPNYKSDKTILAVASTNTDTWLCLGKRDTSAGNTSWNDIAGYPVQIASAGDAPGVSFIASSLALPSNYSSSQSSSRQVFASYDREPDAADDVYLIDDITLHRLNVLGGADIDISSIAYYGTVTAGKLLAGDVQPVAGSLTVQVRRTLNPFDTSPTWQLATVPPPGPGNARVSWSPDGSIAYCGTSESPSAGLDESAFSGSLDGDKWRPLALMNTVIKLSDIVPAPDSESLFITTYSPISPEFVWRSAGEPLGRHWDRLLAMDTTSDQVILRLSPNYDSDRTLYAAEVNGTLMAVSYDGGNSWQWRTAPGAVIDMAIADEKTVYVALPDGNIKKSLDGALTWRSSVDTQLSDINMLAIVGKDTILVGGKRGDVAYSTNGGTSFSRIHDVIGSGSGAVWVVADASYQKNGILYATTNLPEGGIWRWVIGVSTQWELIDESITEPKEGQSLGSLVVGPEGTLYTLRLEPATSTSGGIIRSLNPSAADPAKVEFDLVNEALPSGTTFGPTPAFPNTLPALKMSGDTKKNELWAIDGANQVIYRYQDTLSKVGPNLKIPEAGAIVPIDSSGNVRDLHLNWEALAGTTKYEAAIYLGKDASQEIWSGTNTGNGIKVNSAALISDTTYYWRVRSVEPIRSPWSEFQSFAPALGAAQWSPLGVPTGIAPSPGATNMSIRPAFSWQPADGATGYEFVLARDSGFTDVVVARIEADALPTTVWAYDNDLDYATTYFWKVRAISATTYSEWGISIFATGATPSVSVGLPSPQPEPAVSQTPAYVWVIIGLGVALVVSLVILILRTRQP